MFQEQTATMSRAINGLACNKSNTRVYFARTDAASPTVLFLFDLDFPTMVTKGIRNVWADMMNAFQWSTRLQDAERNDSEVKPHDQCEVNRKQCDNHHPKWMKSDFPVFLTRKCEQHGAITTTNDEMFGCSGLIRGDDVTKTTTIDFRTCGKMIFDGFRNLLSLIHISEPRDLSTSRMPSSA